MFDRSYFRCLLMKSFIQYLIWKVLRPLVGKSMTGLLLSEFKSVKVWPLVFQAPIDEKFHTVPHLKALANGIDPSSRKRMIVFIERPCTTLNSRVELKFLKLVLLLYQAGNIVCNHHAKYFTKILTNKQGKWVSKTENFSVIN